MLYIMLYIYFRYCEDYSLCSECEKTSTVIHDNKHLFLVIDHPTLYHPTQPLLTHNFYGYVKLEFGHRNNATELDT